MTSLARSLALALLFLAPAPGQALSSPAAGHAAFAQAGAGLAAHAQAITGRAARGGEAGVPAPVAAGGDAAGGAEAAPAVPGEIPAAPPGDSPVTAAAPDGGLPPAVLFVSPRSGPFAGLGRGAFLGARLAQRRWGGGTELLEAAEEDDPAANLGDAPGRIRAIAGHLFERSLVQSAPYYRRLEVPVLLPFADSPEAATLGPQFMPLFPSVPEQGRALALELLDSRQRPPGVYILEYPEPALGELADSFEEALQSPPPRGKQRRQGLGRNVKIERVPVERVQDVEELLAGVKVNRKYAVLLALPGPLVLQMLPLLPESNFKSAVFYGGAALAVRDVGAAYSSLGYTLSLCVPAPIPDPKDTKYPGLAEFANVYRQAFKVEPVWSSVSAYDAVTLAVIALATGDPMGYLSDSGGNTGIAGSYARGRPAPAAVIRVHRQAPGSVAYLP
ncbi:MAG: ABC transporter substrate-binding protein [Deltaproteobacteria bacterium]|jgi:ABC-type branched-subunit amino acid transport system substrate-binding protein|nr:ABC transporter substrate-binding protein [Deltaproteobacteria bacterium]